MDRTLISTIFGVLFFFTASAQNDTIDTVKVSFYDPTCQEYLNELRLTCLAKDTARLHALIGENAFGWSCIGGEYPNRDFATDWLIFKNHFRLMKDPEISPFWKLLLVMSENGFFYDGYQYTLPAFHTWGMGYTYETPWKGNDFFAQVFLPDTVILFSHPDEKMGNATLLAPGKPDENYAYRFTFAKNGFHECYLNDQFLGYAREEDVIYWNFHFAFNNESGNWMLNYYEVCD